MKLFRYLLYCVLCVTGFVVKAQNESQSRMYKGHAEQMTRMYFSMLNSLGDPENPISEKEIIVNASFNKLFRNEHVQIEDDLGENRKVSLFKDVQAYLRDVDFFFKNVKFTYEIQSTDVLVNDKGEPYVKVTLNRTLEGNSVTDNKPVLNNKTRFIEINIDLAKQELRIASIYTTKINQTEELRTWWKGMTPEWQQVLGKDIVKGDTITDSQLRTIAATEKVTILNDSTLIDLEPISKLLKLKELNCSNSLITDLMPLRNLLNLEVLDCSNTAMQSIRPLRYANRLRFLNISNTTVEELSDVVNFVELKSLNISSTKVLDISPLENLQNLEDLEVTNVHISDISILESLQELKYLKLAKTGITNLAALRSLQKLEVLDISNTAVQDLRPIKSIQSLKNLYLNETLVSDLTPVSGKGFKYIYCDKAPITKISLRSFVDANPETHVIYDSEALVAWWNLLPVNIRTLLKQQIGIVGEPNTEQLHSIAAIRELDLSRDQNLSNLQPLSMLSRLDKLDISNSKVSSLTGLEDLADLSELNAQFSKISELAPLKKLIKLKQLNVSNTKVSQVNTLSALANLEVLNIDNTNVKDLSPLLNLMLKTVYADGNGITDHDKYVSSDITTTVIYKTQALKSWFKTLPEEWKNIFASYVKTDSEPTPEQLHKIASLRTIKISKNKTVRELDPLLMLNKLKELIIEETQLTSLSKLENVTSLESLSFTQSPIRDLGPISNLKNLRYLDCSDTGIDDLMPVKGLLRLEYLKINGTQISDLSPIEALVNIKELEAYNSQIKNLKPLYNLKRLEVFKCYNSRTSQRRVDNLRESRPKLNIVFYGGSGSGILDYIGL